MMTIQTTVIRLGGLSFGSSQFTFSMVVAVFVLCIALGSFAVSRSAADSRPGVRAGNQWAAGALLFLLLYPQLRDAPLLGLRAAHPVPRATTPAFCAYYFVGFLASCW